MSLQRSVCHSLIGSSVDLTALMVNKYAKLTSGTKMARQRTRVTNALPSAKVGDQEIKIITMFFFSTQPS